TLVDRGDFGQQASWAGAGILPPGDLARARTPYDQLRAHSIAMYPELSRELRALTGIDNGYVVCGGIELPEPGDQGAPWPSEEWSGDGSGSFVELSAAELRRLVPALPASRAVHFPGMAQVRNPRHVKALCAACAARGVSLLPNQGVRQLLRRGARIE